MKHAQEILLGWLRAVVIVALVWIWSVGDRILHDPASSARSPLLWYALAMFAVVICVALERFMALQRSPPSQRDLLLGSTIFAAGMAAVVALVVIGFSMLLEAFIRVPEAPRSSFIVCSLWHGLASFAILTSAIAGHRPSAYHTDRS
ncbi:MAG: hypothetical protein C4297_14645 [Gemmataceae bacterium]